MHRSEVRRCAQACMGYADAVYTVFVLVAGRAGAGVQAARASRHALRRCMAAGRGNPSMEDICAGAWTVVAAMDGFEPPQLHAVSESSFARHERDAVARMKLGLSYAALQEVFHTLPVYERACIALYATLGCELPLLARVAGVDIAFMRAVCSHGCVALSVAR